MTDNPVVCLVRTQLDSRHGIIAAYSQRKAGPGWIGETKSVPARKHAHIGRVIGVEANAV